MDAALGRSSDSQATYLPQLPSPWLNQCSMWSVRSCYRCGAAPDSNRIPSSVCSQKQTPEAGLSIGQLEAPIKDNTQSPYQASVLTFSEDSTTKMIVTEALKVRTVTKNDSMIANKALPEMLYLYL
jgi:hypothetical protein